MALTTAHMLTRLRKILAYDLDGYFEGDAREAGDVTDDELLPWLNQAQDELARRVGLTDNDLDIPVTTGTRTYAYASGLSRRVVKVHSLFVDGRELGNPITEADLEERMPSWRTDANGETRYYTETPSTSLSLFPSPDATAAARSYRARVSYLPTPLSPSVDSELPEEVHPHIPNLAAVMIGMPFATEGQQMQRLIGMRDSAYAMAARFSREAASDRFDPVAFAANRRPARGWLGR